MGLMFRYEAQVKQEINDQEYKICRGNGNNGLYHHWKMQLHLAFHPGLFDLEVCSKVDLFLFNVGGWIGHVFYYNSGGHFLQ